MDAPRVGMSGEYVGLLVILIATPNLHGAACVGHHDLWDAARIDSTAAQQARDICLYRCPCLAQCQQWAATLPRQREQTAARRALRRQRMATQLVVILTGIDPA
jgi:hypothetical protein